jgi:hypothetical protein
MTDEYWDTLSQLKMRAITSDSNGHFGSKRKPVTPADIIEGIVNTLEKTEFQVLQGIQHGANPNPKVKEANRLAKQVNKILRIENGVGLNDVLRDGTEWALQIVDPRTNAASTTALTTVSDETHCTCSQFVETNGNPCLHWIMKYTMCASSTEFSVPAMDTARFYQWERMLQTQHAATFSLHCGFTARAVI